MQAAANPVACPARITASVATHSATPTRCSSSRVTCAHDSLAASVSAWIAPSSVRSARIAEERSEQIPLGVPTLVVP